MGDAVRLPARSIHGRYSTRSNAVTPQPLPRSGFVLRANAGSGDDRIALHGQGGPSWAPVVVDGAAGIDSVTLEGAQPAWSFAPIAGDVGQGVLASNAGLGSYALRNVEHIRFAGDASPVRAGELVGQEAPAQIGAAHVATDGWHL